jgi:hypothetical protein
LLPRAFAARFGFVVGKRATDFRRHISHVAEDVDHLVIAEENDDVSVLAGGVERH